MGSDLGVAVLASVLALGTIVYLGVRLVRSLVLYRLMRAVRSYPNVTMALALASRGRDEDVLRFREWVVQSVEDDGWAKTDEALNEVLRRAYPMGAMGAVVDEEDLLSEG